MPLEVQREQSQQDQLQPQKEEESTEEIEEVQNEEHTRTLYDKIYDMTERFASTRIGQFVTERVDRVLRVIENTAKWSLPQEKTELNLERPLPWIPFLMMIVWLRLIRIWLSVAALLIGNAPVSAQNVVYFIQTRRRKLRAIRLHGAKEISRRREQSNAQSSVGSTEVGAMAQLRRILTRAICRPGMHCEPIRRIYMSHDYEHSGVNAVTKVSTGKRGRDDENIDEDDENNLTVDQMLSKFANENSEDDSDFIPHPNEDTNDESNTSSVSTNSGPDEIEGQTNENQQELPTLSETRNDEHDKDSNDASIELREGGGDEEVHSMPQPIVEIKKEPISDVENSNEQPQKPQENGQGDNREADVAVLRKSIKAVRKLKVPQDNDSTHKSTPGHESAAMMRPTILPGFSTSATAGSPTTFNAYIKPVSILKNPMVSSTKLDGPSTPNSGTEGDKSDNSPPAKKQVQQQSTHRPTQQNQQNRYRGRNRR